jgi:hypothetical protein
MSLSISARVNVNLGLASAATGASPYLQHCFERDQGDPVQAYTFRFTYHYDFNVVVDVGIQAGIPVPGFKLGKYTIPLPGIRGAATGLAVAKARGEIVEKASGTIVGVGFKNLYADWRLVFDVNENVSSSAEAFAVTASLERDKAYYWKFVFDASVGIGSTGGLVGGGASIIGDTVLDSVVATPDVFPADC